MKSIPKIFLTLITVTTLFVGCITDEDSSAQKADTTETRGGSGCVQQTKSGGMTLQSCVEGVYTEASCLATADPEVKEGIVEASFESKCPANPTLVCPSEVADFKFYHSLYATTTCDELGL